MEHFSGYDVPYVAKTAKNNKKMRDVEQVNFKKNIQLIILYRVLTLSEGLCNAFFKMKQSFFILSTPKLYLWKAFITVYCVRLRTATCLNEAEASCYKIFFPIFNFKTSRNHTSIFLLPLP